MEVLSQVKADCLSPDGSLIARAVSGGSDIELVEAAGQSQLYVVHTELPSAPLSLAFSPVRYHLLSAYTAEVATYVCIKLLILLYLLYLEIIFH